MIGTIGKTEGDLLTLCTAEIRKEPHCAAVKVETIKPRPDIREGAWNIGRVDANDTLSDDVRRAVMSVQYRLGQRFHLAHSD